MCPQYFRYGAVRALFVPLCWHLTPSLNHRLWFVQEFCVDDCKLNWKSSVKTLPTIFYGIIVHYTCVTSGLCKCSAHAHCNWYKRWLANCSTKGWRWQDNGDRRWLACQNLSDLFCSLTHGKDRWRTTWHHLDRWRTAWHRLDRWRTAWHHLDRWRTAWHRLDRASSFAILADQIFLMLGVRQMMRMRIPGQICNTPCCKAM